MKTTGAKLISILCLSIILILSVQVSFSQCVQVVEVQTDPEDGPNGSQYDTGEYIKICNTCSSGTVDIGCWVLCLTDESGGIRGDCIRIPTGTTLDAGECFLFGSEAGTNCGVPTCDYGGLTIDLDWSTCGCVTDVDGDMSGYTGVLADGGENITLFDDVCTQQDGVIYCGGDMSADYTVTVNTSGGCGSACTSYDINGATGSYTDMGCCGGATGNDEGYAVDCSGTWSCANHDDSDGNPDLDPAAAWTCLVPIELLNFEAKIKNSKANINWTTGSEMNNDYFMIEKSSGENKFETIANIKSHGDSETSSEYTYSDDITNDFGNIHYRLKQIDKNKSFTYSEIISVTKISFNDKIQSIIPTDGGVILSYISSNNQKSYIEICDLSGKKIFDKKINSITGVNNEHLSIKNVNSGMYILKIFDSQNLITTSKFIK